jgi:hypothetical protein
MQIVSMRFVETGTYNPMYLRPYETQANNQIQLQINEVTQGGTRVNAAALAGVAGQYLRPRAEVNPTTDHVGIVNGWDTRRLRFMAEIHYPQFAGGRLVQLVNGYTNHIGVGHSTFGSNIDPNMTLHFNNSILLQEVEERGHDGHTRRVRRVVNASQILAQQNFHSMGTGLESLRFMRPEDIFSHQAGVDTYGAGNMHDMRQQFGPTRQMIKSRYQNGSASHYLTNAIRGHALAMREADYTDSAAETAGNASANVKEDTVAQDNFIAWLMTTRLLSGGTVTWCELAAAAPGADHVAEFYVGGQAQLLQHAPTHTAGQTAYWHGATMETVFANILAQAIPSALIDCMLTKSMFRATNRILDTAQSAMGGQVHQVVLGPTFGLSEASQDQLMQMFVAKLQREVLPDVSMNSYVDYDIQVEADVFGESRLMISLSGQPHVPFTVPSFSDSLITPVLASSPDQLRQVGSDINFMLGNVCQAGMANVAQPSNPISSGYGF